MIEIKRHYDAMDEGPVLREDSNNKKFIYIGIGGVVTVLVVVAVLFFANNSSKGVVVSTTTPTGVSTAVTTTPLSTPGATAESRLLLLLPPDQQRCVSDRSQGDAKRWLLSLATLDCQSIEVDSLVYGIFNNDVELEDTYREQAKFLRGLVEENSQAVVQNSFSSSPCADNPNESGEWGPGDRASNGGFFTCVSVPNPRIIWTDNAKYVIGDAQITDGNMSDLINWWTEKAGPK